MNLNQFEQLTVFHQAAGAHLSCTASFNTDLRSTFYLSWCSWSPRGLGRSHPHTPRNETQQCGTGSRCIPHYLACTRWVTALGPRSRCIYILRRCCRSCSSHCHTGCSSGQCTRFCIRRTLGQFHQALRNTRKQTRYVPQPLAEKHPLGDLFCGNRPQVTMTKISTHWVLTNLKF